MIPAALAALASIGGAVELFTQQAGDEARLAREAVQGGACTLVVLGGDGTLSHVACELARINCTVPIAIFSAGTGNDFVKSLGAPVHDFPAMARLMAGGNTRVVDVGTVDDQFFINSAGFGFDTEVLRQSLVPGRLRGEAVYIGTALRQLFSYPGFRARATHVDAVQGGLDVVSTSGDARWLTLVFANGGAFGGAFRIAPDARIDDGMLDAVFVSNTTPMRRVLLFARALRGTHVRQAETCVLRGRSFELEFAEPPWYQADGEMRRAAGRVVSIGIKTGALRVVA